MKNRYINCQSAIEGNKSCKYICQHCKKYYKTIEYNLRVPRKLKKKNEKVQL